MSKTQELIDDIKSGLAQKSASAKDEFEVMQSMLNDPEYEVMTYSKKGMTPFNPCKEFRSMCASIISGTTKIPIEEAEAAMEHYTIRKNEVKSMIELSKEFIHTYSQTGRKIPLGGRDNSNISLLLKHIPEKSRSYPSRTGTDEYSRVDATIPAHDTFKVYSPCPPWTKYDYKK